MTASLLSLCTILAAVPTFKGFDASRFQAHDALIEKCVKEFNRHRGAWADANRAQARQIPDLTCELLKAQMIQESGGKDVRSRRAWAVDPLQINVPGDWNEAKAALGLAKPVRRNEGNLEPNVRAAVKYLVRKGFSRSGRPVRLLKDMDFRDWHTALLRYNGRSDKMPTGISYAEAYADQIIDRAELDEYVPIEISTRKKEGK